MSIPFFVVFLERVVHLGDQAIVLCTAVGSAGALLAMIGGNRGMDRLGPGLFLGGAALLFVVSTVVLILYTALHPAIPGLLLGMVVFALLRSGQAVVLAAGDAYLFNRIAPRDRLDGGILYQVARGAGGIAGSIGGGLIVSALVRSGRLSLDRQFLWFWIIALCVACLYFAAAVALRRTEHPGTVVAAMPDQG
jgi:MFS family permease